MIAKEENEVDLGGLLAASPSSAPALPPLRSRLSGMRASLTRKDFRLAWRMFFPGALGGVEVAAWRPKARYMFGRFAVLFLMTCIVEVLSLYAVRMLNSFLRSSGILELGICLPTSDLLLLFLWSGCCAYWMCADLQRRVQSGQLSELWMTLIAREDLNAAVISPALKPFYWLAVIIALFAGRAVLFISVMVIAVIDTRYWAYAIPACALAGAAVWFFSGRRWHWIVRAGFLIGLGIALVNSRTFMRALPHQEILTIVSLTPYALFGRIAAVAFCALAGYAVMTHRGRIHEAMMTALATALAVNAVCWGLAVSAYEVFEIVAWMLSRETSIHALICLAASDAAFALLLVLILRIVLRWALKTRRVTASLTLGALFVFGVVALNALLVWAIKGDLPGFGPSGHYWRMGIGSIPYEALWMINIIWSLLAGAIFIPGCVILLKHAARRLTPEWETR